MQHHLSIVLIAVFAAVLACPGCGKSDVEIGGALSAEQLVDGKVVLGSPSLTGGISGDGALTTGEIVAWLENEENHVPLEVALPESLRSEKEGLVLPSDNPLTRAKIELGRQLFFDKRLSGIGTFACATCHRPEQSFSSYQVMPEVGRNASAVINRILGDEHFWDGRASSLEQQPLSPIKNPFEMNSSPEKSTANILAIEGYRLQFEKIFGEVTFVNICEALACFERVLVTGESAWDRGELTGAAKRGADLFFSDRLACGNCHTGANFSDEDYHNLGTSQLADYKDAGREKVTDVKSDNGSFKTPSLRNVAITPPYMHNGAFRTLEQVIDFFDRGGHPPSSESTADNPLKPLSLTDVEKQDLLEFLKSLTSPLPPVATGRLPE